MADKKIQFRRVHGRVIPMHVSDKTKGAALVGAGLGVAAATGKVARGLVHDAALAENAARKATKAAREAHKVASINGPLFAQSANRAYMKAGENALKTMAKSRQLLTASINIRNAGAAGAAGLIGAGVNTALKDTKLKDDKKTRAAIGTGAAVAAHFTIRSAYIRDSFKPGVRGAFKAVRAAAKHIVLKKFGG